MDMLVEMLVIGRRIEAHGRKWIIVGTAGSVGYLAVEDGATYPADVKLVAIPQDMKAPSPQMQERK